MYKYHEVMNQNSFSLNVHKLVIRWTKCIVKEGDYVEKQYIVLLLQVTVNVF